MSVKHLLKNPSTGRLSYRRIYPVELRPFISGSPRELKRSLKATRIEASIAVSEYQAAHLEYETTVVAARKKLEGRFDRLDPPMIAYLAAKLKEEWLAEDDRVRLEADEGYQTFSSAYRAFGSPEKSRSPIGAMDALQAAGSLAGGHVVSALAGVLLRGNPNGTARFKRDVQESIAEILTNSNPQEVQQAMELIGQQAATDAQFAAALNSVGVQVSRLGALTFGGANGDPYIPTE